MPSLLANGRQRESKQRPSRPWPMPPAMSPGIPWDAAAHTFALAALVSGAAIGCTSHRAPRAANEALLAVPVVPKAPGPEERFRLFHTYFSLDRVGPPAHHFTIWYSHDCLRQATVLDGKTVIFDGGVCGGFSVESWDVPPVPAAVAALVEAAEDAVLEQQPDANHFVARYNGFYRDLVISETIPFQAKTPLGPTGWLWRAHVRANAELTRVLEFSGGTGFTDVFHGFGGGLSEVGMGALRISPSSARLDIQLSPDQDGHALVMPEILGTKSPPSLQGDTGRAVLDRALAVARDVAAGKPVATMGAVLAAPMDASLPETYDVPLFVTWRLTAETRLPYPPFELAVPLHLREAIKPGGEAHGEAGCYFAGVHIRASATLGSMADAPPDLRDPTEETPPWRKVQFQLEVHIEDNLGHVVDQTFPVRGGVVVDGGSAASAGLSLPRHGESTPLHAVWRGNGSAAAVDLRLDPNVSPHISGP